MGKVLTLDMVKKRGWQGDPISPYLFLIGMEAFSTLVNKAALGGFLSGYKVKGRGVADDPFVICR